ncbi:GNAT family N-acetyltransferase [Convivina intestini]|uniref:Uncharacterized protein n=1 Tax=Convivina intestini TaxID=1505726 RepID=A0A2U1D9B0_9LACO|nr:GNAT family N-acetyltransferase [Convivina intestini]PVY84263.1 hypothetical protein C7384_1045 [Convivina intestini]CAH1855316.1 putative protein YjdJ [Convivina intestini]CAH1855321.1 putative protein YjdJ [Convivina intestini]SDB93647.1 hypothetical protein SAMN05216341_1065 [Leuconostocaceae bacterium R-53105]
MEFQHEQGRYYYLAANTLLAEITYQTNSDNTILAIDHTFVDPSLRGQGVAQQLVQAVVSLARENHQKIQPLCSYAIAFFERYHDDYQDVLI